RALASSGFFRQERPSTFLAGGVGAALSPADPQRTTDRSLRPINSPRLRLPFSKLAPVGESTSAPLLISPSGVMLHVPCSHCPPNSSLCIRGNHCDQISTCTSLSKHCPAGFFDTSSSTTDDPRRITVFVNDFFDLFRSHAMPSNMLNIVIIPLCLQLPKPHVSRVARR